MFPPQVKWQMVYGKARLCIGLYHSLAIFLLHCWPPGSVASCWAAVLRGPDIACELSVIAANNVIPCVCISRLTVFDWCQLTLLLSGINSRLTATMCPVFQLPLYSNDQLWSLLPKRTFALPLLLSMPDNNGRCNPFRQVTLKSIKCKFLKSVAFPHTKDNYLFMEEWRKKGNLKWLERMEKKNL